MARIEYAPEVLNDFDRFFDHLAKHESDAAPERVRQILEAVGILANSPLIGRPVKDAKRELVIGQGRRGYVALYRLVPELDTVFILAFRSQRESGFKRPRQRR
jgi:plasmid stabilization system protein ParE